MKGSGTMQGARPDPNTGTTHNPPPPPFNRTATQTERGTPHTRRGGPTTQPPFLHHATHHHNGTPPSTMAPPSTTARGERTEDTPPREQRRHAPATRTPQHPAGNSAQHDSSTDEYCSGMSRTRVAPLHWAGQQQYTPPPFHAPSRMDTTHSSIHLLIHVHTTDDQR